MRTFEYNKLVRDKIVPAMEAEGSVVVWRKLDDDEEFAEKLAEKLEEELDELDSKVGKDRDRDLSELADVAEIYEVAFEVLDQDEHYDLLESAMDELEKGLDMWEISAEELLKAKAEKIDRFGSFADRLYVERITIDEANTWMQRYLEAPDKYPEVLAWFS